MIITLANTARAEQSAGRSWQARLELEFTRGKPGTRLHHSRHQGPLRVQRPFYPEGPAVCHVYILHPPGGVVGGDEMTIDLRVDQRAHALLTTPAAGKFYRSAGDIAMVHQSLHVDGGGVLEWLPQENIFHDRCRVQTCTRIEIDAEAKFVGMDLSCFGLPASGETFSEGFTRQYIELYRDGKPLYVERTRYDSSDVFFEAPWGLGGHSVSGLLLATPVSADLKSHFDKFLQRYKSQSVAASLVDGVLSVRCLGNDAETVRACLQAAWKKLRPLMLDIEACPPRIWAT